MMTIRYAATALVTVAATATCAKDHSDPPARRRRGDVVRNGRISQWRTPVVRRPSHRE